MIELDTMKNHDPEKLADKIAELMADSRIELYKWRYWIPMYLVSGQSDLVVANAKHLADGINHYLEMGEVGIKEHYSLDYLLAQNDR